MLAYEVGGNPVDLVFCGVRESRNRRSRRRRDSNSHAVKAQASEADYIYAGQIELLHF